MIRIAICDDEKEQITYLKKITGKWARDGGVRFCIHEFENAEAFLFDWDKNAFDILLLDIQMGVRDGLSLAREIRKTDERLIIIFITGYDEFMGMGYDVHALHYLMKPVAEEKLSDVLNRACRMLSTAPQMVVLDAVGGTVRLKADDIIYAEMFSHYAAVRTKTETVRVKIKMNDLLALLGEGFFRCHRSYIIGLAHAEGVTRTEIRLSGGISIPLSRKLYHAAYTLFTKYNFKGLP
jgi:DNA-binding LytR/AlgR family response regulator